MDDFHDKADPYHHVTPKKTYYLVFAALMVLTVITVAVAMFDFGVLNTPIALGIAAIKATLVILYFMHVRYSSRLTWLIVIACFLWLGVLFALTFTDYFTRGIEYL